MVNETKHLLNKKKYYFDKIMKIHEMNIDDHLIKFIEEKIKKRDVRDIAYLLIADTKSINEEALYRLKQQWKQYKYLNNVS